MDRPEMRQASDVEDVERRLSDANAGPISIPYAVIKSITKNFAEVIGNGAFGVVYLGMLKHGGLQNGMVAVKKVTTWNDFSDKLFLDEVNCLKRVKHKNIVKFLGYCADTQGEVMEVDRKNTVIAEKKHRFLCFEYVPNGDLHHYLKEKFYGFQWSMRYRIIKGVCEALDYLQEAHIYHLDLKPANVLLGADMEPKITDFGLSRCNDEKKSTILTTDVKGTRGYIAPEMIDNKQISCKSDIYSLGIIMIRLLTGNNGAIVENWHESLDRGCKLMDRCIEIAQICVHHDPSKRPTACDIIVMLNRTEAMTQKVPSFFNRLRTDPPFSLRQMVQRFKKTFSQTLCEHCRMVDISDDLNILERILEGSQKPSKISYPLLQFITRNFSDERKIGHNELGDFFKGILRIVAVTRLSRSLSISDKIFHQEVKLMTMAQHGNIIRLLGNCSYAEENVGQDGEITIDERERLLCFEYLSKGSLKKHLSDELRGLQWHTRYQIIRGICEGLRYLHKERAIVHMYLRPACIILDDFMVPKITEFGISELVMTSTNHHQQREYLAPESISNGSVSFKADIYSLGIIIRELVTGSKETPCLIKVLRRWKHRWGKSGPLWCLQIKKCLELAQSCMQKDPNKRPPISHIVGELNELDTNANVSTLDQINSCLEDMLEIEPLELHFRFEHNKAITRSVELINDTDDAFAFRITASSSLPYYTKPSKSIVGPRSRCSVTVALEALEMAPEQCKYGASRFYVQSTRVVESLTAEDITEDMFDEETDGKVVDKVDLIVFLE
ncbi:hypothetical protein SETIT_8G200000v2 [Setaria italica]|uniref:Protein kinase domain-containing protein n=2 Tax=Setaria italica TaxID=4555 RepID=A0A368S9N6_SETIT|nr:uncharacterized protein LOC101775364 [Setaria italica]RCV39145.1 hypothetical protein SETIT_8G200000v2 [Setaria italica]